MNRTTGEVIEITFVNPGVDYVVQRIMDFQTESSGSENIPAVLKRLTAILFMLK